MQSDPLTLGDLTEDVETLVMEFVNNTAFDFSLWILECVLMVHSSHGRQDMPTFPLGIY